MTITLTFEIELLAGYHVGAGQRRGTEVDASLLRDGAGMPVLRGTTIAGLLRDGFYDLYELLPEANFEQAKKKMKGGVARLFGEESSPKQWRYSSTLPIERRRAADQMWGATAVSRVRINPRTRRSKKQQLFSQEEGDSRLRFRFTAHAPASSVETKNDALLLVAAARMVRHLGGARRRGRGACRLHLVAVDGLSLPKQDGEEKQNIAEGKSSLTKAAVDSFRDVWLDDKHLFLEKEEDLTTLPASPLPKQGEQKRFRLFAQLLEPTVMGRRSEAGNSFETVDWIPGTAVLGALATQAAHAMNLGKKEANETFVELFLRGGIRCSSLLPAKLEDEVYMQPTIAAPLSWRVCELIESHQFDYLSQSTIQAECYEPDCTGKLKKVTGFVVPSGKSFQPKKRTELHIRTERESGRAGQGDLYSYEALEQGQWFVGELSCDAAYWPLLTALTSFPEQDKMFTLRFGKATRRGHGLTKLIVQPLSTTAVSAWVGQPLKKRLESGNARTLTMLLLTDLIIRDKWGRFYESLSQKLLENLLGLGKGQLSIHKQFSRNHAIDSYNTHRRLPRWRDQAIQAGSVVQFTVTGQDETLLYEQMQQLEEVGAGLRTNEGFGQVAFNHPMVSKNRALPIVDVESFEELLEDSRGQRLDIPDQHFVEGWRTEVRRELSQIAKESKKIDSKLKVAYLAAARLIHLHKHQPIAELQKWFTHDSKNRPRHLAQAKNLWGNKTFDGRDKEPKLSGNSLLTINQLLQKIAETSEMQHSIRLQILAEHLADLAQRAEQGES